MERETKKGIIKKYISLSSDSMPLISRHEKSWGLLGKYDFEILIFSLIRFEIDEKLKAWLGIDNVSLYSEKVIRER